MTPQASRKFTILDGMILVAALAGGFGLRRAAEDILAGHGFTSDGAIVWVLYRIIEAEFPFLVTLTPAVLAMRLRRPRPRWRRLMRQPGTAASCAALFPVAISLVGLWNFARSLEQAVPQAITRPDGGPAFGVSIVIIPIGAILGSCGSFIGVWVTGAWLILALSGRCSPEKSWIDRLGRLVGIGWLSILAMKVLAFLTG
jgi:hypothetical protein